MARTSKQKKYPTRSADTPATKGMVTALKNTMNSRFNAVGHKIDARFNTLDGKISTLDGKISTLEAKIDTVLARVHETALRNEAQESNNNVVLEGLQSLYQRQERVETEVAGMTTVLKKLARSRPTLPS